MLQTKDYIVFRGHGASVDQLCWNPCNPDQLATASGDKTVRIWDARANKAAATVNTKGNSSFIDVFINQLAVMTQIFLISSVTFPFQMMLKSILSMSRGLSPVLSSLCG